jgi:hypothetical protein
VKRGQAETMRTMLLAAVQLLAGVRGTEVASSLIAQVATDLMPTKGALRTRKYREKSDALVTQNSVTCDATSDAKTPSPEPSCASRAASESLSSPKSSEILGAEENRVGEEKRVAERSPRNASVTRKGASLVTPRSAPPAAAPTAATWMAYSTAYRARYGADPLRNAVVNGQLARLLQRVPSEEAPSIAQHYVSSSNARYLAAGHTVGCLLQDAEKLRTEWLTGRRTTAHEVRVADRTSGRAQQYEQMFAQLREEDREASNG